MKMIITDLLSGKEKEEHLFAPETSPAQKLSDVQINSWREAVIDSIIFSIYKMAFPFIGTKNERRR